MGDPFSAGALERSEEGRMKRRTIPMLRSLMKSLKWQAGRRVDGRSVNCSERHVELLNG